MAVPGLSVGWQPKAGRSQHHSSNMAPVTCLARTESQHTETGNKGNGFSETSPKKKK